MPLTYSPPLTNASDLVFVQQDKPDGTGLVRCYAQKEPARLLSNLRKMPILVLTSEASYHAPYDHCTVKYPQQAGVQPTFIRLADLGIHGNSHGMMLEENNQEIAGVIAHWLDKALPVNGFSVTPCAYSRSTSTDQTTKPPINIAIVAKKEP